MTRPLRTRMSVLALGLTAAAAGLSASPADAKLCKAPEGYQNLQGVKVTCAKAKQILASYEAGETRPFNFKCDPYDGEEGKGILCTRGKKYVSWSRVPRG